MSQYPPEQPYNPYQGQPEYPPQPMNPSPYDTPAQQGFQSGSNSNYPTHSTNYESPPPPPPVYPSNQPATNYGSPGGYPPYNPGMPNYVPPQGPKKKNNTLLIVVSVIGAVLLVIIGLCGFATYSVMTAAQQAVKTVENSLSTTVAIDPTSTDSTSTDANTGSDGQKSVGQAHSVDGVSVTLVSAKIIEGDDYASPKPGKKFVLVNVKITSVANGKPRHYNPLDFTVITDGDIRTREIFSPRSVDTDDRLSFGDLKKGQTVEGQMVFSVVENDAKAKIRWSPSWYISGNSDARYEWKLGVY